MSYEKYLNLKAKINNEKNQNGGSFFFNLFNSKLDNFIRRYLKPLEEFNNHEIYRVAQEEQLLTRNENGIPDGYTTMIVKGQIQNGLTPIWYTTEQGVDFYIKDSKRIPKGYLIKGNINNNREGYLINFAKNNGNLDYQAINRFIELTDATKVYEKMMSQPPFDNRFEIRNSVTQYCYIMLYLL